MSILPLLTEKTGVSHVIIAAIHLNEAEGDITLNDDPYSAPKNHLLWEEMRTLQYGGVKVLGMLGGAARGSFMRLDGDQESFYTYYEPLRHMIARTGFDGLDLDVEEEVSLRGMIRLIEQLKSDFGQDFLITLAPVATALQNEKHLSGFDYEDLERAIGSKIAWYNTQFYCGWGCTETSEDYERILDRGWPPEKVILGVVTNPGNGSGWVPDEVLGQTLTTLTVRYPGFGGIMGWEYFNSITATEPQGRPWCWAQSVMRMLRLSQSGAHVVASGAPRGQMFATSGP